VPSTGSQPGQPWQYGVTKAAEKSPALLADRSSDSMNKRLRERRQKTHLSPKPGETTTTICDTVQGLRSGLFRIQIKPYRNSERR